MEEENDEAEMNRIEMELAFLGREAEKHSEFMFELQRQIDDLQKSIREIKAQLDDSQDEIVDRKPPHY